jgi:hypothetical protein
MTVSLMSPKRPSPLHRARPSLLLDADGYQLSYQRLRSAERVGSDTGSSDSLDCLAEQVIEQQLSATAHISDQLPQDPSNLMTWMQQQHAAVGQQYRDYRAARRAGAPRQMFAQRAHALLWLRDIAPTKLVDGAWLSGLLPHWQDVRVEGLIRTYLDELGNGQAADHHVLIYQRLLEQHGLKPDAPTDAHYVQGALQLALGRLATRYWPEVLGFHLGYEQLPLHLLISQFELNELGIDPYYFSLHVTIDNGDSGHAEQAVRALLAAVPVLGDQQVFWQRVERGYRLNHAGLSMDQILTHIDLRAEVVALLARKGQIGQHAHADYCRIAGRSINDWLSDPADASRLLDTLVDSGWIVRHQSANHSRFWRLIDGAKAEMFGVFSSAEKQLLHDWIVGDALVTTQAQDRLTYRQRHRGDQHAMQVDLAAHHRQTYALGQDERLFRQQLAQTLHRDAYVQQLITQLSPQRNGHPVGLFAARLFLDVLNQ